MRKGWSAQAALQQLGQRRLLSLLQVWSTTCGVPSSGSFSQTLLSSMRKDNSSSNSSGRKQRRLSAPHSCHIAATCRTTSAAAAAPQQRTPTTAIALLAGAWTCLPPSIAEHPLPRNTCCALSPLCRYPMSSCSGAAAGDAAWKCRGSSSSNSSSLAHLCLVISKKPQLVHPLAAPSQPQLQKLQEMKRMLLCSWLWRCPSMTPA
mmetsp:Transcript_17935/g.50115  ORF Transcript_17935/g.50115 Transcript_17935/m.50115 type:complete len:205 (+) Transcript_17935:440-1054(+)